MQFTALLAALGAPLALAASIPAAAHNHSMIDVQLAATGNSMIKATITNTGDRTLNLLKFNTIMDEHPTRKVMVYQDGKPPILLPAHRSIMLTIYKRC